MKFRPPDNNFDAFYLDGASRQNPSPELLRGIDELQLELLHVKPNIICCLGGEPLKALTGKRGITSWRGSILSSKFGKVVGTFHPAAILREYYNKPIFELDLRRVAAESSTPALNLPQHRFILAPSRDEVLGWLQQVRDGDRLSFDIETLPVNVDDPIKRGFLIRCLGLAKSANEAICIPFMSLPGQYNPGTHIIPTETCSGEFNNHYSEEDEYAILAGLDKVFYNPNIRKVAQNFPFDAVRLAKQFGIRVRGLELDTMVGWHTCYSELPKGLDFLASVLTRVPYYSDKNNAVDLEEWRYNCLDACVTWEITDPIIKSLKDLNLWEVYKNHVEPTLFAATRTENRGILVDLAKREKMLVEIEHEIEQIKAKLAAITGLPDFNPNSPKQLQDLFYNKLGMPTQYARKRNAAGQKPATTDKVARDNLAKRFPQHADVIRLVDEFSTKETLVSGFLRRPVRLDGRTYTHFNITGTVTRRSSSSDPGDEVGTNLQNIPVRSSPTFRDLFIARPSYVLIKADLAAAEYMYVVWRTPIPRIIERFVKEPDFSPHKMMASKIYRIPEHLVDKKSMEYRRAKDGNYGGNYGMMEDKAAILWRTTRQEAKFVLDSYHRETPEIRGKFWKDVQHAITTTRCITSPSGCKRFFFGRIVQDGGDQQEIFRDAYSHDAQSHIADTINRAWHLCDECFDQEDECRVLLQVHDELVFECREDLVDAYCRRIKNIMEYPVVFPGVEYPLIIPAEISYGPTWYQQKNWRAE